MILNRSERQLLFSSLGKKQGEGGLDMWRGGTVDILLNMELPQGDDGGGGDTEGLCNRGRD